MRKHSKLQDMDARKLLRETGIFQEYLSILETMKDQLIVIAVKDTPGFELTEAMDRQLKAIGITSDLTGKHWHGYIAVIHKGKTCTKSWERSTRRLQNRWKSLRD